MTAHTNRWRYSSSSTPGYSMRRTCNFCSTLCPRNRPRRYCTGAHRVTPPCAHTPCNMTLTFLYCTDWAHCTCSTRSTRARFMSWTLRDRTRIWWHPCWWNSQWQNRVRYKEIGYRENRKQKTESRKQKTENRKQKT